MWRAQGLHLLGPTSPLTAFLLNGCEESLPLALPVGTGAQAGTCSGGGCAQELRQPECVTMPGGMIQAWESVDVPLDPCYPVNPPGICCDGEARGEEDDKPGASLINLPGASASEIGEQAGGGARGEALAAAHPPLRPVPRYTPSGTAIACQWWCACTSTGRAPSSHTPSSVKTSLLQKVGDQGCRRRCWWRELVRCLERVRQEHGLRPGHYGSMLAMRGCESSSQAAGHDIEWTLNEGGYWSNEVRRRSGGTGSGGDDMCMSNDPFLSRPYDMAARPL